MDNEHFNQNTLTTINSMVARVCRLYVSVIQLILLRVLHQDIGTVASHAHTIFNASLADLQSFEVTQEPVTPLLICPIAILGTAATRFHDRQALLAVLNEIRKLTGGRENNDVMSFLREIWVEEAQPFDHDAELRLTYAQLDVWRDHERLRSLTL